MSEPLIACRPTRRNTRAGDTRSSDAGFPRTDDDGVEVPSRTITASRARPAHSVKPADAPLSAFTVLHEVFGYTAFRGSQADIVEHVGGGGDALVLMPTGGGKS